MHIKVIKWYILKNLICQPIYKKTQFYKQIQKEYITTIIDFIFLPIKNLKITKINIKNEQNIRKCSFF